MKPQSMPASKPGMELQILCLCLLGNSAVFKILIKALFKLKRLQKYIGQNLFILIFIQPLFTQQQSVFPLTSENVHLHPAYLYSMHSSHSLLSVHISTQIQEQLAANTVKTPEFIGLLLFLFHLCAPTLILSEICGFTEGNVSEEGLKRVLAFQSRIYCSDLWDMMKTFILVASNGMRCFSWSCLNYLKDSIVPYSSSFFTLLDLNHPMVWVSQ